MIGGRRGRGSQRLARGRKRNRVSQASNQRRRENTRDGLYF
jgi:hypothetical protein